MLIGRQRNMVERWRNTIMGLFRDRWNSESGNVWCIRVHVRPFTCRENNLLRNGLDGASVKMADALQSKYSRQTPGPTVVRK
jgi:hypothetical protein